MSRRVTWRLPACRHIAELLKDGSRTSYVEQYAEQKSTYLSTVFEVLADEAVRLANGDVRAGAHNTISVFRAGGQFAL
jgi:hypothetical protein